MSDRGTHWLVVAILAIAAMFIVASAIYDGATCIEWELTGDISCTTDNIGKTSVTTAHLTSVAFVAASD